MILLRLLPLLYALLFILSRRIDVKVIRAEEMTVKINFNIFAIVLTESKTKEKRKGRKKFPHILKGARGASKPVDYLVSKSEVKFFKCERSIWKDTNLSFFRRTYFYFSIQLLTSYLSKNAKKFQIIEQSDNDINGSDKAFFDLSVHFSLWHLFISALILLYYIVKNKVRRVLNNV